jgi:hypothetical protein
MFGIEVKSNQKVYKMKSESLVIKKAIESHSIDADDIDHAFILTEMHDMEVDVLTSEGLENLNTYLDSWKPPMFDIPVTHDSMILYTGCGAFGIYHEKDSILSIKASEKFHFDDFAALNPSIDVKIVFSLKSAVIKGRLLDHYRSLERGKKLVYVLADVEIK